MIPAFGLAASRPGLGIARPRLRRASRVRPNPLARRRVAHLRLGHPRALWRHRAGFCGPGLWAAEASGPNGEWLETRDDITCPHCPRHRMQAPEQQAPPRSASSADTMINVMLLVLFAGAQVCVRDAGPRPRSEALTEIHALWQAAPVATGPSALTHDSPDNNIAGPSTKTNLPAVSETNKLLAAVLWGHKGHRGDRGDKGERGDAGTAPQGPQGVRGDKGPHGEAAAPYSKATIDITIDSIGKMGTLAAVSDAMAVWETFLEESAAVCQCSRSMAYPSNFRDSGLYGVKLPTCIAITCVEADGPCTGGPASTPTPFPWPTVDGAPYMLNGDLDYCAGEMAKIAAHESSSATNLVAVTNRSAEAELWGRPRFNWGEYWDRKKEEARGDKGDKGDRGPKGDRGDMGGTPGPQGDKGDAGERGDAGITADALNDLVLDYTDEIGATASDAVLNDFVFTHNKVSLKDGAVFRDDNDYGYKGACISTGSFPARLLPYVGGTLSTLGDIGGTRCGVAAAQNLLAPLLKGFKGDKGETGPEGDKGSLSSGGVGAKGAKGGRGPKGDPATPYTLQEVKDLIESKKTGWMSDAEAAVKESLQQAQAMFEEERATEQAAQQSQADRIAKVQEIAGKLITLKALVANAGHSGSYSSPLKRVTQAQLDDACEADPDCDLAARKAEREKVNYRDCSKTSSDHKLCGPPEDGVCCIPDTNFNKAVDKLGCCFTSLFVWGKERAAVPKGERGCKKGLRCQ